MLTRLFRKFQAVTERLFRSPVFGAIAVTSLAAGFVYLCAQIDTPTAKAATHATAVVQQPPKKLLDSIELNGGTDWLNTDNPIKLADLRGHIVILDFWTLCCINCIHTLPDLATLEARYPGILVVIGVHTPKFDNEKKTSSVQKAINRYEIKHPVVNDADRKIWNAYNIIQWPTLIVIDPDGKVRDIGRGEGHLDGADALIKRLIKEYEAKGTLKKTPISFRLKAENTVSPLRFPGRVLADAASKRIFIADSTNHRIVITDLTGKKIAIAGSGKEGLKDGSFAEAQFSDPQGMVLDGETLYVADRKNHAIRALDLKKETVKLAAGTGVKNLFGRLGSAGSAHKIPLCSPWDIVMHKKRIYIAMSGHHQIWTYDPVKEYVSVYAGDGNEDLKDATLKTSRFAQPSGLAHDDKRLFVADAEVSAIRSVPLIGTAGYVYTIVGKGLFDFGDRDGFADQVRLQHALAVVYHEKKLYVTDTYNSKIKVIDPGRRTCETWFGGPSELNEPAGLSISGGKMYVADTNNHRIEVIDMKTKDASTLRLQGVDPVRREEVGASEKR